AGVDLIDVKEPRRGPLGKADDAVIDEIVGCVGSRRPLSVALGELSELSDDQLARFALSPALRFAKIGLAHCDSDLSWPRRLATLWDRLPSTIGRVAVIYADWKTACAPSPQAVLDHAANLKARGILVDTLDKSLPGLLSLWSADEIQAVVD